MNAKKSDLTIDKWLGQMPPSQFERVEAMAVRRDMISLLTYLRDKRITGTQSTGNLPLKAVREVTAQFVNPPVLDETIGERVYRLRSESDVWPLYFLHILADVGGLLSGGQPRWIRITKSGEKFLAAIPPVQVWYMLSTWWWQVNWLVAYGPVGMGEEIPTAFPASTIKSLLKQPVGKRIDYDVFTNDLIQRSGYRWSKPEVDPDNELMRNGIRMIVIQILKRFECVELGYRDKIIGSHTYQDLDTFCITSFGMGLLNAVVGGGR